MSRSVPRLGLSEAVGETYTGLARRYLVEYLDKIDLAIADLSDDQVWRRSGPGTNSIGNLTLHLCGNLSLWVLANLGGERYERDRQAEFAADRTHTREELFEELRRVVRRSRDVLATLEAEDLDRQLEVQGYPTDGRGIVFHAVEHMSYHTGQIVLMAKTMLAERGGLEFYPQHRTGSAE